MVPDLKVIDPSDDVAVATFRQLLFVHFRRETPVTCVVSMRAAMTALSQANQKKVVLIGVIELESAPPNQEVRASLTRFFEDHAASLAGFIIAYRGEGFRGAVIRAIVSGVVNMSPRFRFAFPRHVVASLEEAMALALQCSPGLDTAAALEAFRALRGVSARSGR